MKGIKGLTPKQKDAVVAQAQLIAAEHLEAKFRVSASKLSEWLENPGDGEVYVTKLTFKVNWGDEGDCFVIVNATIGGQKQVAFHGGSTFGDAIIGVMKRLENGSMKWRKDTPYGTEED